MNLDKLFKEFPNTKVTFIDQKTGKMWTAWKPWKDCSAEEKRQANLRSIFPSEIILDIEDKSRVEELKKELVKYSYQLYDTGSRGIHIHLFFNNLPQDTEETSYEDKRKAIRKFFINNFKADLSKANETGVIAMENKPHFKTGNAKTLIFENKLPDSVEGYNVMHGSTIMEAYESFEKKPVETKVTDEDFKDWHAKDPFFVYISSNIIPEGTDRNTYAFPNLALGLVKEGLTEEEIKKIVEPIIKSNFPGKSYNEFHGWVKKAFAKEITDFNKFLLNRWAADKLNVKFYRDEEIATLDKSLGEDIVDRKKGFRFIADKDMDDVEHHQTEWLVDKWIAKGDICFMVGKALSYKTTLSLHMGYAISEGKPIFQTYATKQEKVLYLDEENTSNAMLGFRARVKKGLDLTEKSDNIYFTIFESIRLDVPEHVKMLVEFMKANDIKVVFCDSFRRFIGFDENSATEINALFNQLKKLRKETDSTIIILHHLKKENVKEKQDMRDMLRGSSDIVNSADSIIAVKRARGENRIILEQIKNRSGEEQLARIIQIDCGDNNDCAYIYEVEGSEEGKNKLLSLAQVCGEAILKFLEAKRMEVFSKNKEDLPDIYESYSETTIGRAIDELVSAGDILKDGKTRGSKYIYPTNPNKIVLETIKEEKEFEAIDKALKDGKLV